MDPFSEENILLKELQDFYTSQQKKSQSKEKFRVKKENNMKKSYVLQIFFDYILIDNCGYNIYQINEFLHQLNPDSDEIDVQQFFKLIFYLYKTHTVNQGKGPDSEIAELSMDDINDISSHIKPSKDSYNIINLLTEQYKNNTKIFNFSVPDLSNDVFDNVLDYEFISLSSKYMNELKNNIFLKYSEQITEKDLNIFYINFAKINKLLVDLRITSLFNRDILFQYFQIFLKIKSFVLDDPTFNDEFMSFFEKSIPIEEIKEIFDKMILSVDEFNFSFSSIALLINLFAYNLESSKTLIKEEKIRFFFEEILNLKIEDANLSQEKIEEERDEDIFEDYVPESIILNKAKETFGKYSKDDIELISDFLLTLDKVLPQPDENIINFSNEYSYPSKKLYFNEDKKVIPKFPVEKLAVEVEEEKERKILEQEKRAIEKAKKPKKNQKEKVENPYDTFMGEVPNKEQNDIKYHGHEKILTLTHRLIKHTYKEILPNSRVYPSLLKEVLLIPPLCPQKCIESIVECMAEQVNGKFEMAIRRLERAQGYLPKDTTQIDWQTDLFF
jgi:hypothetical protein